MGALETARLEQKDALVAVGVAQKASTAAAASVKDIEKEAEANAEAIQTMEQSIAKLNQDVSNSQQQEQQARDQHAAADHHANELAQAATTAAASEKEANNKKQDAEDALSAATEAHNKALAYLGAAKQSVTLLTESLKGAENTDTMLAMPQSLVKNTAASLAQATPAVQAAETQVSRMKENEATANAQMNSALIVVADTKATIAKAVQSPSEAVAAKKAEEAKAMLEELQRELKAAKALRDQLSSEYDDAKKAVTSAQNTLSAATAEDVEAAASSEDIAKDDKEGKESAASTKEAEE